MESEIVDEFPLIFRRSSLEHAEPVVNAFFSQSLATLRVKNVCSIRITASPQIIIERPSRFIHQIDVAPLAALIANMQPPNFRTNMRMDHLQPGDITDPASCPVTER